MKTTVKTSNEEILKESIMDGIDLNELLVMEKKQGDIDVGKPIKTYKQIGGLNCIGKTFFCS